MNERTKQIRHRWSGGPPTAFGNWGEALDNAADDVAHLIQRVDELTKRVRVLTEALHAYENRYQHGFCLFCGLDLALAKRVPHRPKCPYAALAGTEAPRPPQGCVECGDPNTDGLSRCFHCTTEGAALPPPQVPQQEQA